MARKHGRTSEIDVHDRALGIVLRLDFPLNRLVTVLVADQFLGLAPYEFPANRVPRPSDTVLVPAPRIANQNLSEGAPLNST